jgi:hypothetical protein
MVLPEGWQAAEAVARCDVIRWKGAIWRGHQLRYPATSHGGSLRFSGRYHRAQDRFSSDQTWPALYTGVGLLVSLGEIQRNLSGQRFEHYRFTELWAELTAVLDCRDFAMLGLTPAELMHPTHYETAQALALAARALEVEAILVPSATLLGDSLIIFPDLLRQDSVLVEVRFVDPSLEKD